MTGHPAARPRSTRWSGGSIDGICAPIAYQWVVLLAVNIFVGGGWWSFWPMCLWGLVLAFHFFYYRSVTVDDSWVQERTDDLRLRSYDLSHIRDIEDRVDRGDSSVRPPTERDA